MDRKKFLKTCGFGCLAGLSTLTFLQSCSSSQILAKEIIGSDILVPLTDFEIKNKETIEYKKYVIIQNEKLKYPICVYRFGANNYSALLMQCTHQGTELQVFGDKLQCAAHGSEFSNKGNVENGPADRNLRNFPIKIDNNTLKISLK
ncbi:MULTISPECIES: QcrA and Rieske domain-containing protein [Flavobacterium]|uniref:Rieske 2Fe-2S domain-containing protein n=1 Tax=Flavobacterium gawalongense TaxID=2594432 RepID=A0A553BK47_9FLAO|nr:Rieske (2Fe-2S) protein [Flavobacterium gawalongense]TRX00329.1 Rieske 2Fe-2S domain-containing protein [Flavobacterium gawalongense]TRX08387.1 Rieske 2Fe-2S domain-containing protein [Flavobacterium gawalongense]TRX08617.1 Rieske 2Fe-2S domain-containing protein [Flavobacterium gawalongense]TRX09600.1 Rieske 2Fe-2S domain-containing protein [Flavobacterium gawalongense]TRX25609.1 Rieske 2Fe-2S domain-containing protein [Flavobacterium gawalongense]